MKSLVHFFELFVRHVGINLRRGDGRVPEHFLNRADVGAVLDEVGRERMAQGMRMDVFYNSGFQARNISQSAEPCAGVIRKIIGLVLSLQVFDSHPNK